MARQKFVLVTCSAVLAAVLSVATPMKAADDRNPFALWERLKTEMSADSTADAGPTTANPQKATSEVKNVAYFSPRAAEAPGTVGAVSPETKQKTAAVEPKQERLSVKTAAATPDRSTQASSQNGDSALPEVTEWPNFLQAEQPAAATSKTADHQSTASAVKSATFENSAHASETSIRQTSGDFFEEIGMESDANPFAAAVTVEPAASATAAKPNPFLTANSSREVTNTTSRRPQVPVVAASHEGIVALPSALVGPQTPAVTLQWKHHGEFTVGQECQCDLVVTNSGASIVRNVVAEAMMPQGLQVVASEPAPTTTGSSATWTFGELQPGQTRTVQLVVIPTIQGDHQMNAFVRMTGGSASSFTVTEPAVSVEVEGPASLEVGQVAHYTVNVGNPGTGKAQNVAIQAAIPEGLEHRHGSRLTINIGTLNPGEVRRARLTVTGVKGGSQQLAVRAIGDGDLNDETMQLVSVAEPRLNVGLRGPMTTSTGQPAVYELIVLNEGNVDSSNVRAKYRVPEGYEFIKADAGGKFNPADNTIDWFVGTLDPGQNRHFTVTLRPTVSGMTRHQVGVMSELGGVSVAEHSTDVQGSARLDLTVAAIQPRVTIGSDAVCQIQITNTGGSAAENVGLSCELPSGLELTDISGPTEYIADSGAVIFRKIPKIDAGETITISLKATCQRDGQQKVRVRVASESIGDAMISEATITGVTE